MYRHQIIPVALKIDSPRGVFGIAFRGWITNQAREKEQRSSVIRAASHVSIKGAAWWNVRSELIESDVGLGFLF